MKEFLLTRYPHSRRRLPRDVTVRAITSENGQREPWHRHEHGHLVVPLDGVVRVLTPTRTWTLPPSRALWVPPNIDHELHAIGSLTLCTVSVEPEAVKTRSFDEYLYDFADAPTVKTRPASARPPAT